jgi:hypothetical protein
MREFETQLSQDQAKISKALQRLLVLSFHGMSVYNMQLDENNKIKKDLLDRYESPKRLFLMKVGLMR